MNSEPPAPRRCPYPQHRPITAEPDAHPVPRDLWDRASAAHPHDRDLASSSGVGAPSHWRPGATPPGSPGDPEALRMQEDDGLMPATHRPGLRVNSGITIPESELSWRFSRSSGPGGQGVNTADSRAELLWDAAGSAVLSPHQRERLLERLSDRLVDGVLTITASEHRAQLRNRDAARARLAAVVGDALRPASPPRRRTTPSRGAKERRLKAKKQRTDVKQLRRPPQD